MRYKSLSLLLALQGCWWTAPAHDDGDESFVAQAIETVLGRKPKGSAEIRALADIAQDHGREAVVELLFNQPEYVEYWTQVLADDLQVQRSGSMRVDADCAAPPLLADDLSERLASHLATAPPEDAFCVWVKTREVPRFDSAVFSKAVDSALSNYPYTPLSKLPVAEPITKPVFPSEIEEDQLDSKPSFEIDLDLQGGQSTNDDQVFRLDNKLYEADLKRWLERERDALHLECPSFNLSDVIEASVRADRLDALYRGYLPVLATFPGGSSEAEVRAELGATFLDAYLDRDPICMTCHSATYSKTDARPLNNNWDRFVPAWYGLPVPLDAEGTVFSYDIGGGDFVYGGDGGTDVRVRVENLFRSDNHTSAGIRPWNMDEQCVTNPDRGYGGLQWVSPDPGALAALGGVGPSDAVGVLDLVNAYADGVHTLGDIRLSVPDWELHRTNKGASLPSEEPRCEGCHSGGGDAPLLETKVPVMTDTRLFSIIRNGTGRMPAMAASDDAAWDMVAWVRDEYRVTPALQMKDRRHGLLFLTATNTVNQVVDEVLGENFVMNHGFPRNGDQALALSHLTFTFMERFSLQDVLREIVLSDGFNRRPPEEPATTPYSLQMLPYPEAGVSPVTTPKPLGADANSEGDYVHKHSPAGLLHQVHEALGWPAPPLMGYLDAYPQAELMQALGRYSSRTQREREQFAVDTFLSWETEIASCDKPDRVVAKDVNLAAGSSVGAVERVGPDEWVDWIDVLAAEGTERGDSWRELAVAIKDRLLADPELIGIEEELVRAMWGYVDMDDSPADDGKITGDEQEKLRAYCGVLLASPQFVLRGTRLADELPSKLPEPSCLPEEDCEEGELYDAYMQQLKDLGPWKQD